ncbi:MAG TPA: sulfate permease [Rhodothermales bacterium]|nr:sulfate permease [Rhodothermales bacterium]
MRLPRIELPLISLLRGFSRAALVRDIGAGATVGVILVPQGMAYALIAGVPPIYGLYTALVPVIVYALAGSSRHLQVGPAAILSLIVASGIMPIAGNDPERYLSLAILLSLMAGVIQFSMGAARMGFLANFLSHPVLRGFTMAAAIVIGLTQLEHLLGIEVARSSLVSRMIKEALDHIASADGATVAISIACIVTLAVLSRWNRHIPGALIVVGISSAVVWAFGLDQTGVHTVGRVPSGLPHLEIPDWSFTDVQRLIPPALTVAFIGLMDSTAVAKVYASRFRYRLDSGQEFMALGLANIFGSFFQAIPAEGGFARTAVSVRSGAASTLSNLASAVVVAVTLIFLTPLFVYLPNAALAAIIVVAVTGLLNTNEVKFLWRTDRLDFYLMIVTFFATLVLGVEEGILVGISASLLLVIYQSSRPHTAITGRLPGTSVYRNVERHPDALVTAAVVVYRLDASLYFANAPVFRDQIEDIVNDDPEVRIIIIDAYPINRIDATGAQMLHELIVELRSRQVEVLFAGAKGPVMDVLEPAGIVDLVGRDHFLSEIRFAMDAAEGMLHGASHATTAI